LGQIIASRIKTNPEKCTVFFASCANQVGSKHFYLVQQSPMHTLIYLVQDQRRQRKAEIFLELEVRQSIFYSIPTSSVFGF
jgi:hypothetical protein